MRTLLELRNVNIEQLRAENIQHVAVYGTLREGNGAHRMVEGLERIGTTFNLSPRTFGIYSTGPFPYIVDYDVLFGEGVDNPHRHRQPMGPVIELYRLADADYEERIRRLDMYEGYPALYNRDVVEFVSPDDEDGETYRAILYTWADTIEGRPPQEPLVPRSDWNYARGVHLRDVMEIEEVVWRRAHLGEEPDNDFVNEDREDR